MAAAGQGAVPLTATGVAWHGMQAGGLVVLVPFAFLHAARPAAELASKSQ